MKTTEHHNFLRTVLGPDLDIGEITDRFGDRVFTEDLSKDPDFKKMLVEMVPHAMLASSGYPKNATRAATRARVTSILKNGVGTPADQTEFQDLARTAYRRLLNGMQPAMTFMRAGARTYAFEEGLSERLIHTKIDVPMSLFNTPMKCFQVSHEADCVRDAALRLFDNVFWDEPSELTTDDVENVCLQLSEMDYTTEQAGTRVMNVRCTIHSKSLQKDDLSFNFSIPLGDDPDHRLPDIMELTRNDIPDNILGTSREHQDAFRMAISEMMRVAANSTLYLTSMNADIGEVQNDKADLQRKAAATGLPKKQRQRAANAALTASDVDYAQVGKIYRSSKFNAGAPREQDPDTAGTGRKLDKRVTVSGHYKQQPYGPGRTERRIIFVEPYVKGPDAAQMLSRTMSVPDQERALPDEDFEM
ncbi:MAG: hypothetical protein ABJN42_09970 [Roseibium sp.]|uniref:hypothetical protein n=1 Tax=Roseibium sp. TaxID=1936156 RepID=UPI0032981351